MHNAISIRGFDTMILFWHSIYFYTAYPEKDLRDDFKLTLISPFIYIQIIVIFYFQN